MKTENKKYKDSASRVQNGARTDSAEAQPVLERKLKDSGIPWIGMIPEDWSVAPFKHFVTIRSGECISKEEYVANGDIPVVGSNGEIGRYNKANNSSEVITTGRVGTVGTVHLVSKAWITDNALILEIYGVAIKYAYYLIPNFDFNMMLSGTAQPLITATKLKNQTIILPPLPTQQRIADFLDKKCSEIDELAALQETMIAELKRYKQSVITEAVTKGLDKNVKLKDSGVEWIGEIPEGWKVNKLNRLFSIIGSGTTPKATNEDNFEGDVNWIQSGDINGGYLTNCKNQIAEQVLLQYSALKIYKQPFIVVAMYGASVGNISISKIDGCVNQACCVLSSSKQCFDFLFYAIKSAKDYLIYRAEGGGQPNISQDKLKSLWLAVPPLAEQQAIADFLDEKCGEIDELIAIKQQKIEQLKEYKKSVIFEYVTGKKRI